MIPIDDDVHFDVITSGSTGAATDADSTPTFAVYEEATDTAIIAATNFTKRTSLTGNYRGTFTASAANGFEAGKWYSVVASATVGGVAGKTVALGFRVAPAETIAGVPEVKLGNVAHGGAAATLTMKQVEINNGVAGSALILSSLDASGLEINSSGADAVRIMSSGGNGDAIELIPNGTGVGIRGSITGNITGTISTVTNLTNLPAITAGWLTDAGIAADAFTNAKFADGVFGASHFLSGSFDAVWAATVRTLSAGDNINGSTFTTIPWNAAWDAEVQSEVNDALVVHRLDELMNADADILGAAPPTTGSVFFTLMTKDAVSFDYVQTTDSLEAIRDNMGGSAPSAATIADAVWDEVIAGHLTAGTTGLALNSASAPTTAQIDAALSAAHGAGAWGAGAGSGAFPITVTVNDGAAALQNVTVGVYDGATLAASGTTNVSGQVTFSLDAATYTVALVKGGYTFTTASRTVTGNQTGTMTTALSMTAVSTPSPSDPSLCVLSGFLKDLNGNDLVGSQLKARLVSQFPNRPLTANGNVVALESDTVTSDANGFVSMELIRTDEIDQPCTYTIKCLDAGIEARNVILAAATKDIATL